MARPGPLVVIWDEISATNSAAYPKDSVLCFAVGPVQTAIWSCVAVVGRCPGTAVACIKSDLQVAKSLASRNGELCCVADHRSDRTSSWKRICGKL